MMMGAAAREFLSPPFCSSIISFSPFAPPIKLAPFLLSNKPQNKLLLLQIRPFGNHKKSSSTITISSSSQWISQETQDGVWEEPDGGSDSDYEEEEEEGRKGETVGIDVSGVMNAATVDQSEEGLIKEVEQLLTPEERVILQQNEAPVLSKISTRKWSALHTLSLSLQIPFMDKLLELGVDIDSVDKDGYTPLHKAVMGKKEAVISHLLRKGANPHVRDKDGATPLHYAVEVGAMQTVKLLIKFKVDVNVADDEGWTPLHVAMLSRNRDIAKVLLVNGADKTRRNKDGKTPLDLSLCYGRDFKSYELAKLLKLVPADR